MWIWQQNHITPYEYERRGCEEDFISYHHNITVLSVNPFSWILKYYEFIAVLCMHIKPYFPCELYESERYSTKV